MEITDDTTAESIGGYASERERACTHAGERESESHTHSRTCRSICAKTPEDITADITADITVDIENIGGNACVREKERKRARARTRERETQALRHLSAHLDMPTDDITAKSIGSYACV